MALSVTNWTELYSVSPSLSRTSQGWYPDGLNLSSLEGTLLETSIELLTQLLRRQVHSKWVSTLKMVVSLLSLRCTISKVLESSWECTTLMSQLMLSLMLVSNMLYPAIILSTSALKIPSWSVMMAALKIFLKRSTRRPIDKNLRRRSFGMNIVSSMIWLPMQWRAMEVSYGPRRTTMEMYSQILWHRVTAHSAWWPVSWSHLMGVSRLKLLMARSLDIIVNGRRDKRHPLTLLLPFSPGPEASCIAPS